MTQAAAVMVATQMALTQSGGRSAVLPSSLPIFSSVPETKSMSSFPNNSSIQKQGQTSSSSKPPLVTKMEDSYSESYADDFEQSTASNTKNQPPARATCNITFFFVYYFILIVLTRVLYL